MSLVGFLGVLISLLAIPFAFPGRGRERYAMAVVLVLMHIAASVVYYIYVQTNDADTALYYFDAYGFARHSTALGTILLIQIVQGLRRAMGGSYLDYFLLFQSAGTWGIVLLSRAISEIGLPSRVAYLKSPLAVVFLPSMHFWTSAIGKDAPLFLACSLAAWSVLKLSSRWFAFAAGVGVMILFRPHIAFIAIVSLGLSLSLESKYNIVPRFFFLAVAGIASVFTVGAVNTAINVNLADPNSVSDFLEKTQSANASIAGTTSVNGPFIIRLPSLLFRPMFLDAHGVFGIIGSFENLLFLVAFIAAVRNFRAIKYFFRTDLYWKYCCIFTIILTFSLAAVYYNVGLGLRERVMVYPTLLPVLIIALAAAAARGRRVPRSAIHSATPTSARPSSGPPPPEDGEPKSQPV